MKKNDCLQDRLAQGFSRFKDSIAVEYAGRALTYAQLDRGTDLIAHWLLGQGIGRETFIGVLMEDRMNFLLSMIAILKVGGVFMPLDPALPLGRWGVMIGATDTQFILVDRAHAHLTSTDLALPGQERKFLQVEEAFSRCFRQQPGDSPDRVPAGVKPPQIPYSPEDKVYIYFTSGTTGQPRAILGKNKSLLHFIDWEIETICKHERLRTSQFTSPGFDAYLRDLLVPLASGGVVCIPGDLAKRPDPGELTSWIDRSGIQLIHCVPRVLRMLSSNNPGRHNFNTLKYILLSGEKVNPQDLVPWFTLFNGRIQLVNLWGTSETTLAKTAYFISEPDIHRDRIPVGKPIRGTRVVVLNENLELCKPGIVGDLYIRTPYRTFGYYKDPQLNRERFIPNPFNQDPQDLLHKTGDLGRLLPDGNLDVLGRNDRQVKILGIRVELEEIERTMMKHPSLKEAVVIKKELAKNNELLCAFVTAAETGEEETDSWADDLRAYLLRQLPEYMVPARILRVEKIPLTPSGKINYQRLHGWSIDRAVDYTPPANEIEKKLVEIWSRMLGIEKIGVNSRFFELGGNSLEVLELAAKIHKEFNIKITLFEIFNHPTIRAQAELIKKSERELYFNLENVERKEYYELSPAQKRLYFLQQWNSGMASYNMFRVVQLAGQLDRERLEKTFRELIRRHESFRTSFILIEERPVQRIHPAEAVEFTIDSFEPGDTPITQEEPAQPGQNQSQAKIFVGSRGGFFKKSPWPPEAIIKHFQRPFDLSNAPLIRAGLIKTADNEYLLMVDMHHTVSDGISSQVVVREAAALYRGERLPGLRLQYRDFSLWQTRQKESGILKRQEAYWLEVFAGKLPVLELPTDFQRPAVQSFAGRSVPFEIDPRQASALKDIAAAQQATLFMAILAIFAIFISKITGQEDIVIGTVTAGRGHEDLRDLVGMFVNTLALRNTVAGELTFNRFLASVRERALNAFDNQDYPFEDLVDRVELYRVADRNPVFSVTFDEIAGEENGPGQRTAPQNPAPAASPLSVKSYGFDREISQFDLMLRRVVLKERLLFKMVYCSKLFKRETIDRFIKYFAEILAAVVENSEVKLGDISISPGLLTVASNTLDAYQKEFVFE
jgi:amino acid adenylation domain-containing protein